MTLDQYMAVLAGKIEKALVRVGDHAVEVAKDKLKVPVEYRGGRVIRSEPGEPPRRETGALQEGIISRVEKTAPNVVELEFGSSRNGSSVIPEELELGEGPVAARPYMIPTMHEAIIPDLETAVPEELKGE